MSPVQETDLLLNSLGSALPSSSTDWTLVGLLTAWRDAIEALPMPEWVAA